MRLSFLYLLIYCVFSCDPTANIDMAFESVEEAERFTLQELKAKNNKAPISLDEIRDPVNPSSLPGLQAATSLGKINSVYKEGVYTVISPAGLGMHKAPAFNSEMIGLSPYLDQVKVIDIHNVVKDTLHKNAKYIGYSHSHFDKNISGDWVKVNYQGQEAYAFSAFLSYGKPDFTLNTWADKNYRVNSISKDCILEVHEKTEMNWYGIFKKEDLFSLEPVTMSYRILHEKNIISRGIVNATPSEGLNFCFGTMKEMKRQAISMRAHDIQLEYEDLDQPNLSQLKKSSKAKLDALNIDMLKSSEGGFELILKEGKKTQILSLAELGLEGYWPHYIYLVGDIDQDGKMDYYIDYKSHESIGDAVLYLSSEAKAGELVRPVALNQRGFCC